MAVFSKITSITAKSTVLLENTKCEFYINCKNMQEHIFEAFSMILAGVLPYTGILPALYPFKLLFHAHVVGVVTFGHVAKIQHI